MKLTIFTIICLSLAFSVTCNDLNVGKREPGDVLVASRRLLRDDVIPGRPLVAWSGYNAAGNITAVNAVNAPGSNALVRIVKGGPGTSSVVVLAISKLGEGLDVQLNIYATLKNSTTSA
ncbi:hypothetical protein PV327_001062 [Microctonus hyperodae]|uniref:Uncharacterized protein n=1 Tax=Microctonus hyperodae TaxID=165561 RepID=A0AA39G7T4_MICHY|nr:hypothetical protein PV327_001062 [Microctonus hyperodae]